MNASNVDDCSDDSQAISRAPGVSGEASDVSRQAVLDMRRECRPSQCPRCSPRLYRRGRAAQVLPWQHWLHEAYHRRDASDDQRRHSRDRLAAEYREIGGCLPVNEEWLAGRALPKNEHDFQEVNAEVWVSAHLDWDDAELELFLAAGVNSAFDLSEPRLSDQRELLSSRVRAGVPVALTTGSEVVEIRDLIQEQRRMDATVTITAIVAKGWHESKSARINLANIGDRLRLAQRVMPDPQVDPTRPSNPSTWRAQTTASACEDALNAAFVAISRALDIVPQDAVAWETPADIAETGGEETYIVAPYLADGAHVDVVADPKAGKTTFALAAVKAITTGADFLGFPVRQSPVVYLSEQPRASLRKQLQDAGLLDSKDVHILRLTSMRRHGLTWPEMMHAACSKAREVGARLIVVDTFAKWAGLKGDEENSAGATAHAMQPIEDAVAEGFCVWTLRHARKSGGSLVDSGRGSSAMAGAGDILMLIRKTGGKGHSNRRVIEGGGRFDVPDAATVEWHPGEADEGGRYELVAWSDGAEGDTCETDVYEHLASLPEGEAKTIKELCAALTSHTESTIRRSLSEMHERGAVDRRKRGKADEWFAIRTKTVVSLDLTL